MSTFRATNSVTAEVVEYTAAAPHPEHLTPPWRLEEVVPTSDTVPSDAAPQPGPILRITKLAFRNRFSASEKVAIELASLDNPSAPMPQRSLAATLRANQADLAVAQYIDLGRADTRAGVVALEKFGLIGAGRAAEVLDTTPTEAEVWRG